MAHNGEVDGARDHDQVVDTAALCIIHLPYNSTGRRDEHFARTRNRVTLVAGRKQLHYVPSIVSSFKPAVSVT